MNEKSLRKYIQKTINEAFENNNLMKEKFDEIKENKGDGSSVSVRHNSGRKGPSKSATNGAIGDVATGNDGKKWIIQNDKNGTPSWKPLKKTFDEDDIDEGIGLSHTIKKGVNAPHGREIEEGIGISMTVKKGTNDQSHNNDRQNRGTQNKEIQ